MKINFNNTELTQILVAGMVALKHMPPREEREADPLDYTLHITYRDKVEPNYNGFGVQLIIEQEEKPTPEIEPYEPGDWIEGEK